MGIILLVLLLALIVRRRAFFLYALATLTLAGLSVYPAFFTGDRAAYAVSTTWYVVRSMVEEHDQAAGFALFSILLMGAASAYTWWRMLRREVAALPPVWLRTVVARLDLTAFRLSYGGYGLLAYPVDLLLAFVLFVYSKGHLCPAEWARQARYDDQCKWLLRAGPAVFEGAQGVLLDEWRGFHPYTTWSTTTFANAETLLAEAGETAIRLGVVRCYLTRHGPGPFVTEDPTLEIPEPHNGTGTWQGAFRNGSLGF